MRQLVEKVGDEMQMQAAVFGEEKKILRESVERARNEEYEISHDKIRRQREDIQDLREENERLRSIIDANELAFNELIKEHRDLSDKLDDLNDHLRHAQHDNAELHQTVQQLNLEREDLTLHLQQLEHKIPELEAHIAAAIREKLEAEAGSQSEEIQARVSQLVEEKRMLEGKYLEQNHSIIEMHKNYYRLQAELASLKGLEMSGASHKNG
jgi:chromosome segregation ATPase